MTSRKRKTVQPRRKKQASPPAPQVALKPEVIERLRDSRAGKGLYYPQGWTAGRQWVESDNGPAFSLLVNLRNQYGMLSREGWVLVSKNWEAFAFDIAWHAGHSRYPKAFWQLVGSEFVVTDEHQWFPEFSFMRGFVEGAIFTLGIYETAVKA